MIKTRRTARLLAVVTAAVMGACGEPDATVAPRLPGGATAAVGSSILAAPSNASAVASGTTEITLSWHDNSSNETAFEVHRSTTGQAGPFTLRATLGANVASYHDTGLPTATQYCYQVRAVRVRGTATTSAFSNSACATRS